MEVALEAGADDVRPAGGSFEVTCPPDALSALEAAGIGTESKQLARLPTTTVDLDLDTARSVLKLVAGLDDHDDVQSVAANYNISDEAMAQLAKE